MISLIENCTTENSLPTMKLFYLTNRENITHMVVTCPRLLKMEEETKYSAKLLKTFDVKVY